MINMVLASMELTKKRSTLTFELFQRSQSKWNRALKNPIFFYQDIVGCVFFLKCRSPSAYRTWITNESISLFKYYTVDMQAMHKWWIYYYDLIFINKLYERHSHCFCWTPYNPWTSNTAQTSTKNDIYFGKWNLYSWQREEAYTMHERPLFNTFGRSSGVVSLIGQVNIYSLARYRKPVRI